MQARRNAAYPDVKYDPDVPVLFSEIDPVQNQAVELFEETVAGCTSVSGPCSGTISSTAETTLWVGGPSGCGTAHTCYPPAVNYDPRYYMINGVAFDKSNVGASSYSRAECRDYGQCSVALRERGSAHARALGRRSGLLSLVAEDGNPLPGNPRLQNSVFLPAGKTYDVIVKPTANAATLPTTFKDAAYAIFDRQLSLSTNNQRDGGMLAYLKVGNGALPTGVTPAVQNDTYSLVPGKTLAVCDPGKGVIANDTAVYGVTVLAAPTAGTVTLSANGTFTYVPNSGTTTDSFTYCANGTVSGATCSSGLIATVQISPAAIEGAGGITVNPDAYASNVATKIEVKGPGVLANDSDGAGYPLTVDTTSITATGSNASALHVVGGIRWVLYCDGYVSGNLHLHL